MAIEAQYLGDAECIPLAAGTARLAGEVFLLDDGRPAVSTNEITSTEKGGVRTSGRFALPSASGTTFSVGDDVFWDASANLAITAPGEAADFYCGPCLVAKVSGQTTVEVLFGLPAPHVLGIGRPLVVTPVVEVDTETGVQTAAQNLLPASANQSGLILLGAYGIVSEVFGGASQDQGIVTIEDTDGTDLCTLTPSDAGADAANDVIVGTADLFSASTGDAAKIVAAGKGVQALVSQATSGAGAAGKMKVFAIFAKLV